MQELIKRSVSLFYKVSIYYSIIGFLLILVLFGIKDFGFGPIFWQIMPPLLATFMAGLVFDYLETKKWQITLGPIVSGLIIGLVAQFGEKALVLALIGILAMAVKFALKLYGKNIFNPAGSGLFLGMLLFSSYPAWWGGSSYPWLFYLWIPGLLLKLKRWAPIVGFLVPIVVFNGPSLILSGSLLFFLSVMLIEPMTSPVNTKAGLIYGLIVSFGYLILSQTRFDPLIPALLLGNFSGRLLNRYLV